MVLFISPSGQLFRAPAGAPYPSAQWFAQADANHDGVITLEEFRADALAFFHSLDTDHDGMVDGFEVAAYEQTAPEIQPEVGRLAAGEGQAVIEPGGRRRENRVANTGRRGKPNRQGAGYFGFLDEPEPVAATDGDFDSRITEAEARAAADRRFKLLDPKGTGRLVLAELPKTQAQLASEARAKREQAQAGKPPERGAAPGPAPAPFAGGPIATPLNLPGPSRSAPTEPAPAKVVGAEAVAPPPTVVVAATPAPVAAVPAKTEVGPAAVEDQPEKISAPVVEDKPVPVTSITVSPTKAGAFTVATIERPQVFHPMLVSFPRLPKLDPPPKRVPVRLKPPLGPLYHHIDRGLGPWLTLDGANSTPTRRKKHADDHAGGESGASGDPDRS